MTDCFALLGEPRRPVLDLEALKARFHKLAAESHPDRFHNASDAERLAATERHAALNTAYATLREPKDRLGHLLELELAGKPRGIESVPADLMERFMEVAKLCRDVDAFLAGRGAVTSPLLKVQQFQQAMAWSDRLTTSASQIAAAADAVVQTTAPAIGTSERESALPLRDLETAFRRLSFLTRWNAQLRERIARLAM
jgi:DnaJ-domain-containing protein 1